MNRLKVAIHDLTDAICALPVDTPNRQGVVETALTSLVRLALSEHHLATIQRADSDLALIADIQARAAQACIAAQSGG